MIGSPRYFSRRMWAARYWLRAGTAPPVAGASSDNYMVVAHGDMNTAMELYLREYYSTTNQDLETLLARYLREGGQDMQNRWTLLQQTIIQSGGSS